MDAIKEKYPIAAWVESTFKEFHGILMGNETNKVDVFIETYGFSTLFYQAVQSFIIYPGF